MTEAIENFGQLRVDTHQQVARLIHVNDNQVPSPPIPKEAKNVLDVFDKVEYRGSLPLSMFDYDVPQIQGNPVSSVDEAKLLHDIVLERVRLPQDVRRVEFRLGEDSTGAPAIWIVFVAHDDLKPSKSKIASLQRAAEEVRSIVHSESNRWPYIEIATE
jgi:hypothetical protein